MWIHCVQCVTSGCRGGLRALGWISVLGLALACSGAEPDPGSCAAQSRDCPGACSAGESAARSDEASPEVDEACLAACEDSLPACADDARAARGVIANGPNAAEGVVPKKGVVIKALWGISTSP
jgi:hypothetical protein